MKFAANLESKLQPSNSNLQKSANVQSPKRNRHRVLPSLGFGAWFVCGAWILVFGALQAFPPAPPHELFGMVRDQWGNPLNVSGAKVFLETTSSAGVIIGAFPINEPGVNYRLRVPMDAGITPDLYKPTALKASFPFRLRVKIGQTTYLPIEMALSSPRIGQPAQSTRLDLTLGEDSDGDGLPDAWERALIAALGGNLTLADIRPDDDSDADGISNLQEYLSGTYAFDPTEGFSLSLVGFTGTGSVLELLAIRGRTYTLEASSDLRQWTPVQFRVATDGPGAPLRDNYAASELRLLRVEVPFQSGGTTNSFFKARVQ